MCWSIWRGRPRTARCSTARPPPCAVSAVRSPRHRRFGPYEGLLHDPRTIRRVAELFAPARPAFSASALESYAFCPFQFLMKFVLRLEPIADRDEFEVDFAARGSLLHRLLQVLHEQYTQIPPELDPALIARLTRDIEAALQRLLDGEPPPLGAVAEARREIESRSFSVPVSATSGN